MDRHALRQKWINMIGGLPKKTPLDARIVEQVHEPHYIRQKVWYWSEPNEGISAYVLVPTYREPPYPAVVCLHQHNSTFHIGKSEPVGLSGDPDMAYAHELAKRGYMTIVPDFKGFEDRRDGVLEGSRFETYLATQAFVQGTTLQRRHVWDMIRTVDYLLERPEVDVNRIGCIGHSLGGQEAYFLMASDERVKAGVVNCGIANVQSFFDYKVVHNPSWYIPGFLDFGDTAGLIELIAPRPLYMISGLRDPLFPIPGVQAIVNHANDLYRTYGKEASFRATLFDGGHRFPQENRMKAYAWIEQWV